MAILGLSIVLLAVTGLLGPSAEASDLSFGDDFWAHWGDGRAELASYDLVFPRYGELRQGTAVAIFVTETFSDEARVKADPGVHPASDEFPVMKLNLVRDFATGLYDYNLMTSAFYAVTPFRGRPAGSPMKVSFSAQEWCGHAYHQLLPMEETIRSTSHSYFDREADRDVELSYPGDAVLEDGLFHWARGFAAPAVEPGAKVVVPLLRSLDHARLVHRPPTWTKATLTVGRKVRTVEVPAGSFEVREHRAEIVDGPTWTFLVESNPPHRIVSFENTEGQAGQLVGTERLPYWEMNGNSYSDAVEDLGLHARPPRTP
ncbi:MAG: hypothetical protein KC591_15740 [Gemmatimonadetes bacterium]|nr:hypothetical protein [Gemmatimonadota bacterium]